MLIFKMMMVKHFYIKFVNKKIDIDEEKRKEFILLLLEKGANPTIKDKVIFIFKKKFFKKKNRMEKHVKIMQKKMENALNTLNKIFEINGQNQIINYHPI